MRLTWTAWLVVCFVCGCTTIPTSRDVDSKEGSKQALEQWRATCADARVNKVVNPALLCTDELATRYAMAARSMGRGRKATNTVVILSSIALPALAAFEGSNAISKGVAVIAGGAIAFDNAYAYEAKTAAVDAAVASLHCGTDAVRRAKSVEARAQATSGTKGQSTYEARLLARDGGLDALLAEELMALVDYVEARTLRSTREGKLVDAAAIRASIQAAVRDAIEDKQRDGAVTRSADEDELAKVLAELKTCKAGL